MKLVLLCGGDGKRLWPLSNGSRSKQFLKLLHHKNGYESMLQRNWRMLKENNFGEDTYIITNATQAETIQSQISDFQKLIVEPEGRDTFPAVAFACMYLFEKENIKLDDFICVAPVDSYVENDYFEILHLLPKIVSKTDAKIGLIGMKATYPATKFGYIIPNFSSIDGWESVYNFVEKPEKELAKLLITQRAVWNAGVFCFKLELLIKYLADYFEISNYNQLVKSYDRLPKISFDRQILERTDNILFVRHNGVWEDIGSWDTLLKIVDEPILGRGFQHNCKNTNIINELQTPIFAVGTNNINICASRDGIIVSESGYSTDIKEALTQDLQPEENLGGGVYECDPITGAPRRPKKKTISLNRPMLQEKRWGHYEVIDFDDNSNTKYLIKKLYIKAGQNISYQYHNFRNEIWYVLEGTGLAIINYRIERLNIYDTLTINKLDKHSILAKTDMLILETQIGVKTEESDIVRLKMNWDDIIKECEHAI